MVKEHPSPRESGAADAGSRRASLSPQSKTLARWRGRWSLLARSVAPYGRVAAEMLRAKSRWFAKVESFRIGCSHTGMLSGARGGSELRSSAWSWGGVDIVDIADVSRVAGSARVHPPVENVDVVTVSPLVHCLEYPCRRYC